MLEHYELLAPYPGLRPFEPHEATIFFGRESHVGRLLEILVRERFLVVIGPSGSGKSSLVRAGMLPALTAGWAGTGSDWRVAVMRPGDRPMRSLAQSLAEPAVLGPELDIAGDSGAGPTEPDVLVSLLEAELRRGPRGLQEIVAGARQRHTGAQPFDLLVLVDQFEEIFRYSASSESHAEEADAFVKLLLEPRGDPGARLHVALTMRSDFLGNCVRFPDLPDAINRAQYLTPRLDRVQLASVIADPARVFSGEIEPGLVTELVNTAGADLDQLPVLQHALARMWDSARRRNNVAPTVTRGDLLEIGGVAGSLTRHADALLDGLSAEQRHLAEILFRAITERGSVESGGRDTRRPRYLGDIADAAQCDWQSLVPVVLHFAQEGVNFLTHGPQPLGRDTVVDISHEALIRQWDRLKQWVIDESDRVRGYQRLRQRAADYAAREGELLTGTDLLRATEWLHGRWGRQEPANVETGAAGVSRWTPTAGWAAQYSGASKEESAVEFAGVLAYLARSEEAERASEHAREEAGRREREREQERLEAEKRAAEAKAETERERAEAARREGELAERLVGKLQAQRKIAWAIAIVAMLTSIAAIVSYLRASDAEKAAIAAKTLAEQSAEREKIAADLARTSAIKEKEAADLARTSAIKEKEAADLARASAIKAKEAADLARKSAIREKEAADRAQASAIKEKEAADLALTLKEQLAAAQALQFRASSTTPLPPPAGPAAPSTPAKPGAGRLLDDGALAAVAPQLTAAERGEMLPPLQAAMKEFGIDTPLRQAAFLANVVYESGGLKRFEENLNYPWQTLRRIFSSRFPTDDMAKEFDRQPEKIANRIYADRLGNGSEASRDGWRYRGRGPIQILGRGNYRKFGEVLGADLEKEPDQARTYPVGFRIAGAFWRSVNGNDLADQGNMRELTRRFSGAVIGLADREDLYARAKVALGVE